MPARQGPGIGTALIVPQDARNPKWDAESNVRPALTERRSEPSAGERFEHFEH